MPISMDAIAAHYLNWDDPDAPRRNKYLSHLEGLINAIDTAQDDPRAVDAVFAKIRLDMGDDPDPVAQATLRRIIHKTSRDKWDTKVSTVEILKHICMVEGGNEGRHTSVKPPTPWQP